MTAELPPVRRIVTAIDADGRSIVAEDGVTPAVKRVAERPGYIVQNVWVTTEAPVSIAGPDATRTHAGILPPPRGTILRIIDFPPEPADAEARRRGMEATFRSLYPDADHKPETGHPGMHATQTVDYAIILSGEIFSVLDDGETLMRAGDVLIQRGTNHAWANRSGAPCRIAFVLMDGQ
jgi:hypothetical protein